MEPFKQTASFVIAGKRAAVEFTAERMKDRPNLTVDLQPVPPGALRFSMSGDFEGMGQIDGRLREFAGTVDDPAAARVVRLCDLWDALHMNDMSAGTRAQMHALEQMPPVPPGDDRYKAQCDYLETCGLLTDRNTRPDAPYKYGSGWLYRPAEPALVEEARAILRELDGGRIGRAVEPGADDFEEAEFSNSSDVIDSRDVVARIEYLRDYLSDLDDPTPETYDPEGDPKGDRSGAVEELATLEALEREAASAAGDWEFGETLIRDDHFEDFARDYAEEIGAINRDAMWPNNCIDWERAARELQQDYTSVQFGGVTYWIR